MNGYHVPSLLAVVVSALLSGCNGGGSGSTGSSGLSSDDLTTVPDAVPSFGPRGISFELPPLIIDYSATEDQPFQNRLAVQLTVQSEDSTTLSEAPALASNASTDATSAATQRDATAFDLNQPPEHGRVSLQSDGSFIYFPTPDFFGEDAFIVAASAGDDSEKVGVRLTVAPEPDRPVVSGSPPAVIEQGQLYDTTFSAVDVDGDTVRFSGLGLPEWLSLSPLSGKLSGQPTQADTGVYTEMRIVGTDSTGLSAQSAPFNIEVLDINDSPTVNPDQFPASLDARQTLRIELFPDDPDGDRVTLSTEPNDFVSAEVFGGSLELEASDVNEVTDINLVVIATDRLGRVSREVIPLTLHPLTESGRGKTLTGNKSGSGVHIVILGDGYKSDEQGDFVSHIDNFIDLMRLDPATSVHLDAINFHRIFTPSVDSGVDDDVQNDFRDTVYDAGYFCQGIARLICADELKMFNTALDEYPWLDQIILLVNDPRYGGSGATVAIASGFSPEIALHEMGHSIAGLADEYIDDEIKPEASRNFVEGLFPNVSSFSTPSAVPWVRWLNEPEVGVFEGAYYRRNGLYRATLDSRMRSNDAPFGKVNGEQWVKSLYRMSNPVLDFSPVTSSLSAPVGTRIPFSVVPLFDETVQGIQWFIDGREQTDLAGLRSIEFEVDSAVHSVRLLVRDISGALRLAEPNVTTFDWEWEVSGL